MDVMDVKGKIIKRERGPNWEQEEKVIFFHCYQKFAKVLEDTKKDYNTNSKKNQAWLSLMENFNSHSNVKKREVRNLKKFWETEKAKSRKAFTSERNSRMKTGGGEEEKIVDSPNPDVEALLGKPHIVEWCNDYDGDSVLEKPLTNVLIELNTVDNTTSYINDTFKENNEAMTFIIDDDTPVVMSTPGQKTQNPKTLIDKKVKKLFQGDKTTSIIEECELRVKKQKISIKHENTMNELQILNQKLIMQGLVAKRLEENKLYKLQCQKLALEIKQLKESFMD